MIKIKNMKLPTTGKEVPNQFIIQTDIGVYFQSYDSVIAFKPFDDGDIVLSKYWDYSSNTGKYRNIFLNETRTETIKKITSNVYYVVESIEIE